MGDPNLASVEGGSSPGTAQPLQSMTVPVMGLARQPLPKQITAAIKSCTSLERLVQLCQAHQAVLNPIHIAAAITKLPKLEVGQQGASAAADVGWPLLSAASSAQQQQLRQLLQQLLSRLQRQGCGDHSPRGVANIVWALAKLQCAPDAELRGMLLDSFCQQLGSAVPQDISNVLWGVAKLTKEHAPVLLSSTPGNSMQQPSAQDASSTPAAGGSAALTDPTGPLLQQEQLVLLLRQLCSQLQNASVQTISNSLWAVVVLQQEHQWCMCSCMGDVQTLLSAFCSQPQQALPGHIQPIIRCMAQLATACSSHAAESWLQWQPPLLQRLLDYLASQRDQLELHHLSSVLRDVAQIVCLHLQLQKRSREQQGAAAVLPATRHSSTGSVPSLGGGTSGHVSMGLGGASPSSSTASSSSMLGPSAASSTGAAGVQPLAGSGSVGSASAALGEDVQDVLAQLAASGGPQDASSTVLALAMLWPQLQQLGLQAGVAALCGVLPPAALPHLGPEVGQRLLAAASQNSSPSACSPTAVPPAAERTSSGEDCPEQLPPALPVSSVFAARVFAQSSEGLPLVPVPLAVPGSVSSSSGSSVASPTDPSPLASFGVTSPTAAGLFLSGLEVPSSSQPASAPGQGVVLGSNPGHNPGGGGSGNPGSPLVVAGGSNPGHGGNPGLQQAAGGAAAAAAAGAGVRQGAGGAEPEAAAGGDSQEDAAARQLTHNIAYADSVFQLADIFTAHASVMDMIHITACITRLSKVLGTSPSQASQAAAASLLPLLGSKLLAVLPHANARGIANVLWGYGRLRALPQVALLPPLVQAFLQQLPNAACRDSAVVLWSLARLSEGHGEPAEGTLPPQLLRKLGREVLQQLATAAQEGGAQLPGAARQQQPGTPGGVAAAGLQEQGRGDGHDDVLGPPSSRDVSNSLMALARLGFVPEDDTAAAAAAAGAGASARGAQAGQEGLAGQLSGLSLGAGAAAAGAASSQQPGAAAAAAPAAAGGEASTKQLTLPLSLIKAVVDYLLRMSSSAKTLDLQETATALKQLGLRELHAKVTATVITHHGSAHGGPSGPGGMHGPGGMQFMQFGGGRMAGQLQGRPGGAVGHMQYGGGQYGGLMQQQQRRQQGMQGGAFAPYGQGGWVSAHQGGPGGQFEGGGGGGGGMMLRQALGPGGYMSQGPRQGQAAGQMLRQSGPTGMAPQQQQQSAYVLSPAFRGVAPAAGGRQSLTGYTSLAAAGGGMAGVQYGGSPAGGGYAVACDEQQQQASLLQQQPGGGGYAPQVQYMLLPHQLTQQGVPTTYLVQQPPAQPQQAGAEFLGVAVLPQQVGGDPGPPGLVAAGGGSGQQQQYYLQTASTTALIMPVVGQEPTAQQQQQLFLQTAQAAAAPGLGSIGQYGGAGLYQASAGMMMPDTMTSAAYTAAGVGDMFLGGQQQQPSGARSQLQVLQQQMGQPAGLYQQQQPQPQQVQGFAAQDAGALYLQQSQQQLPVLYGVSGQPQQQPQQQQQQFGGRQAGTFVLDPTTGIYHIQQ